MTTYTGWKCCHCGRPLPKRGTVWQWRYRKWKQSHKNESGYYCDGCADHREAGFDMYP